MATNVVARLQEDKISLSSAAAAIVQLIYYFVVPLTLNLIRQLQQMEMCW